MNFADIDLNVLPLDARMQLLSVNDAGFRSINSAEEDVFEGLDLPGADEVAAEENKDTANEEKGDFAEDSLEEGFDDSTEEPEGPFDNDGPPSILGSLVMWCENCKQFYLSPIGTGEEDAQKAEYIRNIKQLVAECPRCHKEATQFNSGLIVDPNFADSATQKAMSSVRGLGKGGKLLSSTLRIKETEEITSDIYENDEKEQELLLLADTIATAFNEKHPEYCFEMLEIDSDNLSDGNTNFSYKYEVTIPETGECIVGQNSIIVDYIDSYYSDDYDDYDDYDDFDDYDNGTEEMFDTAFEEVKSKIALDIIEQIETEDFPDF